MAAENYISQGLFKHQVLIETPTCLAHSLGPPNSAEIFLSSNEIAHAKVVNTVPSALETEIVFTKNIKRLYKNLGQFILYDSRPVLLCGAQGTGKTTLIEKLAKEWPNQSAIPKLIQIYLDESLDSKALVGTYICAESYGEFSFKKGPLTVAAEQGWWVILENIDKANDDIMPIISSLIEKGELSLPTREGKAITHSNFRIFATSQMKTEAGNKRDKKPLERYFHVLNIQSYTSEEIQKILKAKFAMFECEELLKIFLASLGSIEDYCKSTKGNGSRQITFNDIIKLSKRIQGEVQRFYNNSPTISNNYLVEQFKVACISELYDCLICYMDSMQERLKIIDELCKSNVWNLDSSLCVSQLIKSVPKMLYAPERFSLTVGRCTELQFHSTVNDSEIPKNFQFAYTSYALRAFEGICQALKYNEALLLVGPTGVGKTLIVQQIAKMLGVKLVIYNMNCMSDSSDLLGGFKPIVPKYILLPFVDDFLKLFSSIVNRDANQQFLNTLTTVFNKGQYGNLFKCIDTALLALLNKEKDKKEIAQKIEKLQEQAKYLRKQVEQIQGHFAYQYVEGALIKSLQNGDWVLLDELNLASDELLQKLAPLIEGRSLTVTDRSDLLPVTRNPKFRLICCMNPGGTVGKRQLPLPIRSKFTEIYMGEMEDKSDILYLIKDLMGEEPEKEKITLGLTEYYIALRTACQQLKLQTANNKKPTFSIRNLCRALTYIKKATSEYGIANAVKDGVEVCLLSQLDQSSKEYCIKLLHDCIPINFNSRHQLKEKEGFIPILGYNLPKGLRKSEEPDKWFITTGTFEENLKQLAKIIANTQLPILLEGQTSSGKTSMIEYLACKTENHCIRINNHLNTDVQEYIGSYVPDSNGKLYYQEGALIEAVRNGYWIILDELNLAPSEVLEALNRLLDDNREIFISETQTMVKAHPMFRVFATQNPTEGYGGRKELSEAFRNRFIIINVPDIPLKELSTIVEKRCSIPPSYAIRMVNIMEELQLNRRETDIMSGKQSFITVRDLIKWATRPIITLEDVAYEGYNLLAERLRSASEKEIIKKIIEKHCKVKLNVKDYHDKYCARQELTTKIEKFNKEIEVQKQIGGLTKISWTNSMKRLYALTDKCVKNKEPVLLVGETGCGKTTVCQLISLFEAIQMFTISCHQNSEASDFIGGLRTKKGGKSKAVIAEEIELLLNKIILLLAQEDNDTEKKKLAEEIKINNIWKADSKTIRHYISKINKIMLSSMQEETVQEMTSKIIKLLAEDEKLFEWENGPLVKAMIEGGILLIDEISLTDDSVIERINSVLEKERVLILSEKSSQTVEKFVAHPNFCVLATMNPGGDYGKKELSPALRNRFTEVWVDSFFTDEDFIDYGKQLKMQMQSKLAISDLWNDVADRIDLYQVIREKLQIADPSTKKIISHAILQLACWFNQIFILEMNIERKLLSLRDVLSILEFINKNYEKMPIGNLYYDSISLILLDGLATNSDFNQEAKDRMQSAFRAFLEQLIKTYEFSYIKVNPIQLPMVNTEEIYGIKPYFIEKGKQENKKMETEDYCIEVKTPKENLHRILRALSLDKPILLEGSPGVGKTSLIEYLAKKTGHMFISISLSEQTDMMDLLGCEFPLTTEQSISGKPEFRWCDGVLLRAIKEGWWVIVDELNLASQSVLEGLNAILDHRKNIFIPELNVEFQCHPQFRFFGTQSPARQGASRKNLPKSFLNRFAKIYLDFLSDQDLVEICAGLHKDLDVELIKQIVKFNSKCRELKERFVIQSTLEYNLRDVKRTLQIIKKLGLKTAIKLINLKNLRSKNDKQTLKGVYESIFKEKYRKESISLAREITFSDCQFKCGNATTQISSRKLAIRIDNLPEEGRTLLGREREKMEDLIHCLNFGWPMVIAGPSACGKTILIKKLAALTNHPVIELIVGANTDSSELLGFFEQVL